MGSRSYVVGAQSFEQVITQLSTEFFTLVSYKIQRHSKATEPLRENGISDRDLLLC